MFTLWAPKHESCSVVIDGAPGRVVPMEKDGRGYFRAKVSGVAPNVDYGYLVCSRVLPDPASRYQPLGVHGRSRLVDPSFRWTDESWRGVRLEDLLIYEVHVGTFTAEGTFDSLSSRLSHLADLGVTAVELMPVAQFPGKMNWGYDGVFPYAVQNTYGGPDALKSLVDRAHRKGLAVILDVVYNHVGPEGNYLDALGPYFSAKYTTPWGKTYNFDDTGCDEVRKFVVQNALYWFYEYHVDGLRLDAVHAIYDGSPKHILQEICDSAKRAANQLGRDLLVIAESDLNDPRVVRPPDRCGYGADAQWSDDFHHAVHSYLTGEKTGYYSDFGGPEPLAKAFTKVFVYDGVYSRFRGKTHGAPVGDLDGCRFVVYSQNHDQVGNRSDGLRLIALAGALKAKMAAALTILSPYVPLIFMGEEYGELNPFLFFCDFSDDKVAEATREAKKREMGDHYVDPQSEEAFQRSKLDWSRLETECGKSLSRFYRRLIEIRRQYGLACDRNVAVDYSPTHFHVAVKGINLLLMFEPTRLLCGDWILLEAEGQFPHRLEPGEHLLGSGLAIYVDAERVN